MQQVAQVLKSNGTDGELVLGFREAAPEDINLNEPVFIVFDGLPVPFFIESFTKRGNTKALVRLTDICSMEDVEEITGKAVYVEDDSLPELTLEEDGYAALVGWTVLVPEIPDQVGDDKNRFVGDDKNRFVEDDKNRFIGDDKNRLVGDDKNILVGDDKNRLIGEDKNIFVGDDKNRFIGEDKNRLIGEDKAAVEPSLPALTGNLIEVGQISDFMDIPNNPCIEVETENGAVIIPLHEDFILSVDPEYQEIIMQIPDGLL